MNALLLLAFLTVARASCPDLAASIEEATDATLSGRLEEAKAALQKAEASFACGTPAKPMSIAHYWLAEAAVAAQAHRDQDAADAWQAAARLDAGLWEPRFGAELRPLRDAAVAAMSPGEGSLRVDPFPSGYHIYVDGRETSDPTPAAEGLHVVQVAQDQVIYGRVILLTAGENLQLRMPSPPPPALVELPAPTPESAAARTTQVRRIALLAGGGLSAAAGTGLLFFARGQEPPMDETLSLWRNGAIGTEEAAEAVDRRWANQRASGVAGYGLLGLGLGGIGLGIVW